MKIVLSILFVASNAFSLSVSPTNISVYAPEKVARLTLSSEKLNSIDLQVQIFKWTQKDGQEILTPTRDVISTPPIVKVPAKGSQIIRLVRVATTPINGEESYRIITNELPQPTIFLQKKGAQAQMTMSFSIPAYFMSKDSNPKMEFAAERLGNSLSIKGTNSGNRHFKVKDLSIEAIEQNKKAQTIDLIPPKNSSILPQSSEFWGSKPIKAGFNVGDTIKISYEDPATQDISQVSLKIQSSPYEVFWSVQPVGDRLSVKITFKDGKQFSIRALSLEDAQGKAISCDRDTNNSNLVNNGQLWISKPIQAGFKKGNSVLIMAETELGSLGAQSKIQ